MKKKFLVAVATLAIAAIAVPASPASAKPATGRDNPAQYCRSVYGSNYDPLAGKFRDAYVVRVEFSFGGQTFVDDFALYSFQACVSTVAGSLVDGVVPASAVSMPAYLGRCDDLVALGVISYPHLFYGAYPAENRADCARILQGVHSGQLPLPGSPPNA